MKVFNAKSAAEDYMSVHTLTYSTPEMTLLKFAKWLGEMVDVECKMDAKECPNDDGLHPRHKMPRLMLYIEERAEEYRMDVSEEFLPTGAVTTLFSRVKDQVKGKSEEGARRDVREASGADSKFCISCGARIDVDARFCTECGIEQV
ncbi:MAG: zinc ribbon domain-containing protein [Candidatus Nitrosocaldus sp.]|nr:zinc ribbon domain-containing protein [Candidatus Nitrosocaldus sp.]MDW8276179.1 zinc ribbon domain-containing protein [Candidatus Nitrosocaldus sp.]